MKWLLCYGLDSRTSHLKPPSHKEWGYASVSANVWCQCETNEWQCGRKNSINPTWPRGISLSRILTFLRMCEYFFHVYIPIHKYCEFILMCGSHSIYLIQASAIACKYLQMFVLLHVLCTIQMSSVVNAWIRISVTD